MAKFKIYHWGEGVPYLAIYAVRSMARFLEVGAIGRKDRFDRQAHFLRSDETLFLRRGK
jgi:hypothetical protein